MQKTRTWDGDSLLKGTGFLLRFQPLGCVILSAVRTIQNWTYVRKYTLCIDLKA